MDKKIWIPLFCIACSLMLLCIIAGRPAGSIGEMRSEYVQSGSVRVHYKETGRGSKALVFIHGFGCDMNTWEAQYEAFRGKPGLRMVFIDLPGYGKSGKPEADYTLQFFADAVDAVLKRLDIEEGVIVGHSLGTAVCRQYLISSGRKFSLCDIDGVYCFYQEPVDPEYDAAIQAFASSFDGPGCRANIEGFVIALSGPETPDEVKEYAMRTMPETPEYVASSTMHHLVERRWWDGTAICNPVAVICTRNSGLDPDNKEKMSRLYPLLDDYTELTDCGHFIHMEQPSLVNSKLSALLEM